MAAETAKYFKKRKYFKITVVLIKKNVE